MLSASMQDSKHAACQAVSPAIPEFQTLGFIVSCVYSCEFLADLGKLWTAEELTRKGGNSSENARS